MQKEFGQFLTEKRVEKKVTLKELATALQISPAYLCDIEKGRRYPPAKEKLGQIADIFQLTKEERIYMYDLAAFAKEGSVSADLVPYIMENEILRAFLRKAQEIGLTDEDWKELMTTLEK